MMAISKTTNPIKNLVNYDAMVDNVFPTAILALVSIIQGVSFYILVDISFKLFTSHDRCFVCKINLIPYSLFSLMILTVILYEYFWFINLFTGHSNICDILSVVLLGVLEIAPMYCMDFASKVQWFSYTAALFVMGIAAYTNSISKAYKIEYKPAEVKGLVIECTSSHRN